MTPLAHPPFPRRAARGQAAAAGGLWASWLRCLVAAAAMVAAALLLAGALVGLAVLFPAAVSVPVVAGVLLMELAIERPRLRWPRRGGRPRHSAPTIGSR